MIFFQTRKSFIKCVVLLAVLSLSNRAFSHLPDGSWMISGNVSDVRSTAGDISVTNLFLVSGRYDHGRFLVETIPTLAEDEIQESAGWDLELFRLIQRFPTLPRKGLPRDQAGGIVEPSPFSQRATPPLVTAMLLWTQLHSTVAVGAYAAIATLVLAVERSWRRATLVVVAVGGGLALNALMKLAFHRARPSFDDPLLTLATYSFPSGHVAGSTIFYGLAVVAVFARTTSPLWRVLALVAALLAVALVAFSRMLLGVHYLSDVVAAFAEGVAWLALCAGVLGALWREAPRAREAEPA